MKKYTLSELEKMPTLRSGHFDDVKVETYNTRVTLSRMTIADGAKYNNEVTELKLLGGVWKEVRHYQAK